MQGYKDGSGLQFINFDFVTSSQGIIVSGGIFLSFFSTNYFVPKNRTTFFILKQVMF